MHLFFPAAHCCFLGPGRKLFTNRCERKDNQNKNEDDIGSYSPGVNKARFENYPKCKKYKREKEYPDDELYGYNLEKLSLRFLPPHQNFRESDVEYFPAKIFKDRNNRQKDNEYKKCYFHTVLPTISFERSCAAVLA